MKKPTIPLLLTALYLIIIYPMTFLLYNKHIDYPGCSGMGCIVGNMLTGLMSLIAFLGFIVINFIITTKLLSRYAPQSQSLLWMIHCLMIGILLILFWVS